MTVHTISADSVAVIVEKEELAGRGISPMQICCGDAHKILELARESGSVCVPESAELTLYVGTGEVLLFARRLSGLRSFFAFNELEDLIAAAAALEQTPPSSLYYLDGRYILALRPYAGEEPPIKLRDFSEELKRPAGFEAFLAEHGRELARGFALDTIRRAFAPQSRSRQAETAEQNI